jgi:hypothetical protein
LLVSLFNAFFIKKTSKHSLTLYRVLHQEQLVQVLERFFVGLRAVEEVHCTVLLDRQRAR